MSFGGSFGGDLSKRAQIILGLQVEGGDVVSRTAMEMTRLKEAMAALQNAAATSGSQNQKWVADYQALIAKLQAVTSLHNDAKAAVTANAQAMANAGASGTAWTAVIQQSGQALGTTTERIRDHEQALRGDFVALGQLQGAGLKFQDQLVQQNLAIASGRQHMIAGTEAANRFGYGMLHISHAIQDAQYGFSAVLNNIPLIVQALGGGPGLAGTVMVAGVAFEALKPKLIEAADAVGNFAGSFFRATEPIRNTMTTVGELEKRIKELVDKRIKLTVDFDQLNLAREKLGDLKESLDAFNAAAKQHTPMQERVSKGVKEAVSEFAGGTDDQSGAENLAKLVEAARRSRGNVAEGGEFFAGHPMFERYSAKLAEQRDARSKGLDEQSAYMKGIRETLAQQSERMTKDAREGIQAMIGNALQGRDVGIRQVMSEVSRSPEVFRRGDAARGIAPAPDIGTVLAETRAPELRKYDAEDAAEKNAQSMRETDKFIRGIRREQDRKLGEALTKQGQEAEAIALKENREMLAEQRKQREGRIRQRDQEIGRITTLQGGEFMKREGPGSLSDAILKRMAGDVPDADIKKQLGPQMTGRLKATGVPEDLIPDVSEKILRTAIDRLNARAGARAVTTNEGAAALRAEGAEKEETAMQKHLAETHRKIREAQQHNAGANRQAMVGAAQQAVGIDPGQAALGQQAAFIRNMEMTMLHQQAQLERMGGFFGQANQALAHIQQQQMMVEARMRNQVDQRVPLVGAIPLR